jgi:hypothetical protein
MELVKVKANEEFRWGGRAAMGIWRDQGVFVKATCACPTPTR